MKDLAATLNETVHTFRTTKTIKGLTTNNLSQITNANDKEKKDSQKNKNQTQEENKQKPKNPNTQGDTTDKEKKGKYRCNMCQEEHPPWNCTTYTTGRDRINALRARGLCSNCGMKYKADHQCYIKPCGYCGGRHRLYCCLKIK